MASYNKITLVGNVGRDPELKEIGNSKVVDVSIAVNEPARGQNPEKTEWYRVSFWDRKAEIIAQYVKKGSQMLVEGKLSVRTYFDNNTQKERYSLEVAGLDFVLLGNRLQEGENTEGAGFQRREVPSAAPSTSPVSAPAKMSQDGGDDLPF